MNRPKAKLHEVLLTARKDGDHITFEPSCDLWHEPSASFRFHKDHHGLRKQDFHLVEFVLADRTGQDLRFPATPHEAMWVTRSEAGQGTCPDRNSISDYEVLDPISVSDDGKRLIVRNSNPRQEQWAFTLNFTTGSTGAEGSHQYVSWDPIIDNHNGGS